MRSIPFNEISIKSLPLFSEQFDENENSSKANLILNGMRRLSIDIIISLIQRFGEESVVASLTAEAINSLNSQADNEEDIAGSGDVKLLLSSGSLKIL